MRATKSNIQKLRMPITNRARLVSTFYTNKKKDNIMEKRPITRKDKKAAKQMIWEETE